jgi:hypothetical protein
MPEQLPKQPLPDISLVPEQQRGIIKDAMWFVDGILTSHIPEARQHDFKYVEGLKQDLSPLVTHLDRPIGNDLGYHETAPRGRQLLGGIKITLDQISKLATDLGVDQQPIREEIEGLLAQAALASDAQRTDMAIRMALDAFTSINRALEIKRQDTALSRKSIRGDARDNAQMADGRRRILTNDGREHGDHTYWIDGYKTLSLQFSEGVVSSNGRADKFDEQFIDGNYKLYVNFGRKVQELIP